MIKGKRGLGVTPRIGSCGIEGYALGVPWEWTIGAGVKEIEGFFVP